MMVSQQFAQFPWSILSKYTLQKPVMMVSQQFAQFPWSILSKSTLQKLVMMVSQQFAQVALVYFKQIHASKELVTLLFLTDVCLIDPLL